MNSQDLSPLPESPDLERSRRRIVGALFIGNGLASIAYLVVITIAALAAQEITGSARLSGLPNALGTVGATIGASALSLLSRRRGRLFAFPLGFFVSAVGAALAASSVPFGNFPALLLGMALLGFGRSVALLSRFAAGDLRPRERRASAIGFVVWAATIGSVVGPALIVPSSRLGEIRFGNELVGPFLCSGAAFLLAAAWYFVMLRPEPLTLAVVEPDLRGDGKQKTPQLSRSTRELLRLPVVRLSLAVLMSAQFVMVFLMTMMPLHVRAHHEGLALVSGVMMTHALGMYAFAPLTGYLVDRLGARPMIALGGGLLIIASGIGVASGDALPVPTASSLFLLGVGWNFAFVAASAVLQKDLPWRDALHIQGIADSVTWASGGLGAVLSGFVMASSSFHGLALIAGGLAFIPWIALFSGKNRPD